LRTNPAYSGKTLPICKSCGGRCAIVPGEEGFEPLTRVAKQVGKNSKCFVWCRLRTTSTAFCLKNRLRGYADSRNLKWDWKALETNRQPDAKGLKRSIYFVRQSGRGWIGTFVSRSFPQRLRESSIKTMSLVDWPRVSGRRFLSLDELKSKIWRYWTKSVAEVRCRSTLAPKDSW